MSKPRVLWVGDAVVSSGFAACTHPVCDLMHEKGWDVHVLGINYFGDPHKYPYPIYPCYQPLDGGNDYFGVFRLGKMIEKLAPDIVVFLNDTWNIPNYMEVIRRLKCDLPKTVGWIAVDAKNQPKGAVNGLDAVVTWTQFAADEILYSDYPGRIEIVPLGTDHDVFKPLDKDECRERITIDDSPLRSDVFLVGSVGRNQYRKRLDLTLQYFSEFVHGYNINDARLFLHIGPTGDNGFDLDRLIKYYGVSKFVHISEGDLGSGLAQSVMPVLYSMMDVYLSTTQGEGWDLPCLEAMACGKTCIVPDWAALGDWARGAAVLIPCTSNACTAPMDSKMYTIGGIPDKELMIEELYSLYKHPELREKFSQASIQKASEYSWDRSATEFVEILESL